MTGATADDKVRDKGDHEEETEDDDEHLRPEGSAARGFRVGGSARAVTAVGIAGRLSHELHRDRCEPSGDEAREGHAGPRPA